MYIMHCDCAPVRLINSDRGAQPKKDPLYGFMQEKNLPRMQKPSSRVA